MYSYSLVNKPRLIDEYIYRVDLMNNLVDVYTILMIWNINKVKSKPPDQRSESWVRNCSVSRMCTRVVVLRLLVPRSNANVAVVVPVDFSFNSRFVLDIFRV